MTRRLLPYEHDLIEALGVTKEEYLEFIALQEEYSDPKVGTVADIRNDFGLVALIVTVVGVLFQVGAALLAPRPQISSRGQGQTRESRFAPRFGFNSSQELGKYGDPVPLVYADRSANPEGGVRVAGNLLWSAVQSYGGSQFLRMMMMLAGHPITEINPATFAFGQTVVRDLISQNYWIYFNNATGTLRFSNELKGQQTKDPTYTGSATQNPYYLGQSSPVAGYSQAYSPSTSNSFGVYAPVPINVQLYLRNNAGRKQSEPIGITLTALNTAGSQFLNAWNSGNSVTISSGARIALQLNSTPLLTKPTDIQTAVQDERRNLATVFDNAGSFKIGSAKFRVNSVSTSDIDIADVKVELECIEAGRSPLTPYNATSVADIKDIIKNSDEYIYAKQLVDDLLLIDNRPAATTANAYLYNPTTAGQTLIAAGQNMSVTTAADLVKSGQLWKHTLKYTTTRIGFNTNSKVSSVIWTKERDITPDEINTINAFISYEEQLADTSTVNSDRFYRLKALARFETASYSTITPSHVVEFAIKSNVFQRVSGRQAVYGSKQVKGYPASDNGITQRSAMFIMRFRAAGDAAFTTVPGIFVIRRAAEQDNFNYIRFAQSVFASSLLPLAPKHWQFEFEPIADPVAEARKNSTLTNSSGLVTYYYIENSGGQQNISAVPRFLGVLTTPQISFIGSIAISGTDLMPPRNRTPQGLNEWDLFSLDSDTQVATSFERGPEFTITSVTEQQVASSAYNLPSSNYDNLALVGFSVYSGRNLQDMRSFTAFVNRGKSVRRLRTSGNDEFGNPWGSTSYRYYPLSPNAPSNYAPDIFLDTVLDAVNGIGKYATAEGLDIRQLALTKRFCERNKLFMDGIIADVQNWREFWVQAAPFSLLEFARLQGRETLIPAVPYNQATGDITREIAISALYNQGNILEDSYREEFIDYGAEVSDIIATVIYRALDSNGVFPVNRSVTISRRDASQADAIDQTFDLSAFVTTEAQAILYGKLMCNLRRFTRKAIEFKTFPTTSPIRPGDFIYVDIGHNSWNNTYTGVVGPGNKLNIPAGMAIPFDNYQILVYKTDRGAEVFNNILVNSNYAYTLPGDYEGHLFILGTVGSRKRVFRITEVQMDEEGEVTIRATHYPVATDPANPSNPSRLLSEVANFSDSLFTIQR